MPAGVDAATATASRTPGEASRRASISPRLDALAADLHLVVQPAQVFQGAILAPAHEITRAIEPRTRFERIGHEAFRRETRPGSVAAREPGAAQEQLARRARRHGLKRGIEHVGAQSGDGPADRHRAALLRMAGPVRDVDGGLRRAVEVVERRAGQALQHLAARLGGQRLAAAHDAPHAGAGVRIQLRQQGLQHGGHEVQRRHRMPLDERLQLRGLAVRAGGATARRAPTASGQKNSHTDTSKPKGVFCSTVSPGPRP